MAGDVNEPGKEHPGREKQQDEEAKQSRISDILHSGGFRTKYTIENMRQLRGIDLGAEGLDQPAESQPADDSDADA